MSSELLFLLSVASAGAVVIILDYYYQHGELYYGNGRQANYVHFVLETVRPKLFRDIAGLQRHTFDSLVQQVRDCPEFRRSGSIMLLYTPDPVPRPLDAPQERPPDSADRRRRGPSPYGSADDGSD